MRDDDARGAEVEGVADRVVADVFGADERGEAGESRDLR